MDKITFIPEDELEDRRVYLIAARNLRFGVWCAENGRFYGVREKLGSRFIDSEQLWGEHTGTARAREATEIVVPEDIELEEILYLICQECRGKVEQVWEPDDTRYSGKKCVGDRHLDPAEAEACPMVDNTTHFGMWLSNKPLLEFMEKIEADNPDAEWRMP